MTLLLSEGGRICDLQFVNCDWEFGAFNLKSQIPNRQFIYRTVAKTGRNLDGFRVKRTVPREASGIGPDAGHDTIHGRSCVMASKTVRRSVRVRRSPVPPSGVA